MKIATPSAARHFFEAFTKYLETNVDHAQDRENDIVTPLEGYLEMRRPNIGGRSLFFVGEIGLNIPDEAYYHPVIKEMQGHILDLITIDNVSSYGLLTRATACNSLLHFRTCYHTTLNRP